MRPLTLLLTLALIGCNGNSPTEPQAPQAVTIIGTVRDYGSNAPVPAAAVRVGSTTVIADDSGRYVMTLPAGKYEVAVAGTSLGNVSALTSRTNVDLLVNGGTCRTWYGSIVDAQTGFPVSGATIDMASVHVTTSADGSYRIDLGCEINTGSGTGFMNVSHPDYRNASLAYRYEHLAPPQRHDVTLTRR